MDYFVAKYQELIEQNYADKISVEELSNAVALNRRTFERRLKKAIFNTVSEYSVLPSYEKKALNYFVWILY